MIKKNFINYGITSRSIQQRYNSKRSLPYNFEIIQEISLDSELCWQLELYLKEFIKNNSFKYLPKLPFKGSKSETFIF